MSECLVVKDGHSNEVPAMSCQFTEADRAVLAQLIELGVSKQEIAARLKKNRSSVYRALIKVPDTFVSTSMGH
jgi:predicted transcriptional regulator